MKKLQYLILISFLLLLAACSAESEVEQKQATIPSALITSEQVHIADMPVYLRAVGTVKAESSVQIRARTSGELIEVHIKDGDQVIEGQLLFSLDKAPLNVALKTAEAMLEKDKAQLGKAQDDLSRSQQLSKSGFTSNEQYEQARTNVAMLQAAIKADEASVERAKLDLSYADIKAPISGRVGAIQVDKGNFVTAQQQILTTIENISTAVVTFAIPERNLTSLRLQEAKGLIPVKATTADGTEIEGHLTFIDNIDSTTGTVMLKAEFNNNDKSLWVGQFVNVAVTMEVLSQVLIVPERAVNLGPDGPFVYVVKDNIAHLRLVKPGIEEGNYVVIDEGLSPEETVVVEGHVRLYDQAPVHVKTGA